MLISYAHHEGIAASYISCPMVDLKGFEATWFLKDIAFRKHRKVTWDSEQVVQFGSLIYNNYLVEIKSPSAERSSARTLSIP